MSFACSHALQPIKPTHLDVFFESLTNIGLGIDYPYSIMRVKRDCEEYRVLPSLMGIWDGAVQQTYGVGLAT